VGLRRQFHILFGDEPSRAHYKFFIASLLSGLLVDVLRQNYFDFQKMAFLNAKLSRRLSKLEDDRTNASMPERDVYEKLFHLLGPGFLMVMKEADARVQEPWENFKKSVLRPVPKLPRKIFGWLNGQDPFYLTLPNSSLYLQGIATGQAFLQSQQYHGQQSKQIITFMLRSFPEPLLISSSVRTSCRLIFFRRRSGQRIRFQSFRRNVHFTLGL
jgi:hypothetical protein